MHARILYSILLMLFSSVHITECMQLLPKIKTKYRRKIMAQRATAHSPNKTILIFLDDSEQIERKLGAISLEFLAALIEQVAPILVSGSLIQNIYQWQAFLEKDPQKIVDDYNKHRTLSNKDEEIKKNIILSIFHKSYTIPSDWIVKEVDTGLYLLVPKKILQQQSIYETDVTQFINQVGFTSTEYKLGLKVNHMKTIVNMQSITGPVSLGHLTQLATQNLHATYFIEALWNEEKRRSYNDP